ncbi:MAG: GNAT family N-acetyltransferase [Bacilli bacterium]
MAILNDVSIRLLKDKPTDYQYLYSWYQNKEVYTYFEQRILSYEEIVSKYRPRTKITNITPVYIIEYQNKPVGIIQYTKLNNETKEKYCVKKDGYELDIFVGESKYHHLGIGSSAIKLLIKKLKEDNNIFIMIPEIRNTKAIKCYQKVGFTNYKTYQEYDTLGQNIQKKVIMLLDNPANYK